MADDLKFDFIDDGDEDDNSILDSDDLKYTYDDTHGNDSDSGDGSDQYRQDDDVDDSLDFLNDAQDDDDFSMDEYADDDHDDYVLGEEPGNDGDGILDMGEDDWDDEEDDDSDSDYDDGDVNVEETFNDDSHVSAPAHGEHRAPAVPDLPSMPRMQPAQQENPAPEPEQHHDAPPAPPQAPAHVARHASSVHNVDTGHSVDSAGNAYSAGNDTRAGSDSRARSGFAPEPLSETLIAKIIVVYNDYMKMSDTNRETLQQFLNIMYNDDERQLEASTVIKRVIEIDPAKRDALHSLLTAKRKSGSDRAFYLIGLSRAELNELYQMYLNSWNEAKDIANGGDFVKGETIQEISRAAQWLNDAIEKYPTAMIPYIESSDKILQNAYHTMQS